MTDIKAIKTRAAESDVNGWSKSVESNTTVIALCDEIERLRKLLTPLSDEQIHMVVRRVQPYLSSTSGAYQQQFAQGKYWINTARKLLTESQEVRNEDA